MQFRVAFCYQNAFAEPAMPTLTIKKVPQDLYEKLRERAALHRRSMNSEAIACLEQLLVPTSRELGRIFAEAEELDREVGKTFPDIVNDAKKQGRR